MSEAFLERRRTPRVVVSGADHVEVPHALSVNLVDLSGNGVLLICPQRLSVGQRARLRATLGREPLDVEIQVKRIAEGSSAGFGPGRYRIGACFVEPDADAVRAVRLFLRADGI